jgi:hypothetical protein
MQIGTAIKKMRHRRRAIPGPNLLFGLVAKGHLWRIASGMSV